MATAQQRENLAVAYGTNATKVALFTTATTGTTPGTEVTGGTYARQTPSWSNGTVDGSTTCTVTFNVPAGVTVVGAGLYDATGNYLDGGAVTSQNFASAGTYTLTVTFTQN